MGDGHFEMRKLPGLAQAAPGFGVQDLVVGRRGASLFVAQNFYTAQRETGRMNGGVGALLVPQATSETTADFGAVWPDVSGILVPEDAKSVAAVDINGEISSVRGICTVKRLIKREGDGVIKNRSTG